MRSAIILTPQMIGADGVSEITRQIVAALQPHLGGELNALEVWSLMDEAAPRGLENAIRFRAAGRSRVAFAGFALRAAPAADANTVVVALHAHLLPIALPLVAAGARLVPVLLGIEAWKPLSRLERAAFQRSWRAAAISRHTIEGFRAANPELRDMAIRVCHPGVREHADEGKRSASSSAPIALIAGRMASDERYKGHDELIEAWPQVRAAVPGATLVVAGGGDDMSRLVEKARQLGVSDDVRFEGRVSSTRLATLYREATVFAMPSAKEGFGIVYVEAMRSGTPCVALRGAAEEIIEDGVTGVILPSSDRDTVAGTLIDLLSNRARCFRMGQAAAADVARRFSAAAFAERVCNLLEMAHRPVETMSSASC
jgi:glycosyltransferase involved in cell wall biosynthesis